MYIYIHIFLAKYLAHIHYKYNSRGLSLSQRSFDSPTLLSFPYLLTRHEIASTLRTYDWKNIDNLSMDPRSFFQSGYKSRVNIVHHLNISITLMIWVTESRRRVTDRDVGCGFSSAPPSSFFLTSRELTSTKAIISDSCMQIGRLQK